MTMQWSVKILALYTYLPSTYVGDRTHKRRAKQAERACVASFRPKVYSIGVALTVRRSAIHGQKMSKANNGDERHISTAIYSRCSIMGKKVQLGRKSNCLRQRLKSTFFDIFSSDRKPLQGRSV